MYNKIKEFLISFNFIVLMFSLLTLRSVLFGSNLSDAIVIIALCSLYGFQIWVKSKEKNVIDNLVQRDLDDLKVAITGMQMKNSIKQTGSAPRFF